MRKLIDAYCQLLTWLMVATVAILVVPVSLQIVSRYTQLIPSYIWTEELSRFLFIWMVMLGSMIGIKEGTHFEVDIWPEMTGRGNAILKIVSSLLVLVFALVFVYWGIKFVEFGWHQESELAELPMPYIFVAWPLAGVTWLMVATVAALVVPVSLQIVSRYTQLIPSYIWTEELSRFLFIWMVMLGAMVGIKEGTHFEVDIWPELGRRANAMLKIVSNLFVLIFALVFVYWGIKFVEFGWHQESELAELPMPFIFVAWPLAGVTWVIFLGEIFLDNIRIVAGKAAP